MSSFWHVSCIKVIREEKPTEDLNFRDALGLPQPTVGIMRNYLSEVEGVVGRGFKDCRPPSANPGIFGVSYCGGANICFDSSQFIKCLYREGQDKSLVKMGDGEKFPR